MPTRFYLPTTGDAAVLPPYASSWTAGGADRLRCVTTKINSAFATKAVAETVAGVTDILLRQYVSDRIGAGAITGTVKGIIRAMESATQADMRAQFVIRVVSEDGQTVRGTLLAISGASLASEFATALTNRKFPLAWAGAGTAVSSVTAQNGDRIVIEVGYRAHNTQSISRTGTLEFGDPTVGVDLLEDETNSLQGVPWIELSATLPAYVVPSAAVEIAYAAFEMPARSLVAVAELAFAAFEFPVEALAEQHGRQVSDSLALADALPVNHTAAVTDNLGAVDVLAPVATYARTTRHTKVFA